MHNIPFTSCLSTDLGSKKIREIRVISGEKKPVIRGEKKKFCPLRQIFRLVRMHYFREDSRYSKR